MTPSVVAGTARRRARRAAAGLLAGLFGAAPPLHAAGGHHSVEDASLLEPATCQVELWVDRAGGGRGTLLHGAPACRVGPVELSLNLDRFKADGSGTVSAVGPQLKWAREFAPALSAGLVVAAFVQDHAPNFVGTSVIVPLTWEASESLRFHVNAGRDFLNGEPDPARSGAAVEWQATPVWSLVAERFRENRLDFWRAGVRYAPRPDISIDLSRAEGMAGAPTRWALGLGFAFGR